jgi:hypothetical protein
MIEYSERALENAIRLNDVFVIKKILENLGKQLFLGHLDRFMSDETLIVLLENGFNVTPKSFDTPMDLVDIALRLRISDLQFWNEADKRFFPEVYGDMPKEEDVSFFIVEEGEDDAIAASKIIANFKLRTRAVSSLRFTYFNFDLVTKYFTKKYKFNGYDAYIESLAKWEVYNSTAFARRAVKHALTNSIIEWEKEMYILLDSARIPQADDEIKRFKISIRKKINSIKKSYKKIRKLSSPYAKVLLMEIVAEDVFDVKDDLQKLREEVLEDEI